jgi:cell division protein FtsI (penicillin-binding protein 3)
LETGAKPFPADCGDAVDQAFKQRRARIGALTLALAGLFALIALRLTAIVLDDGPRLISLGRNEHSAEMQLAAVRGPIVDRNGIPLALSAETRSIYAHPRILLATASPAGLARLAAVLGLSDKELRSRLANRAPFVWLARHLPPSRAREIEQLGFKGVGAVSEYKRFYPEGNLAEAVVGMAGIDGQGLSGVELQYDKLVRARPVELHLYQDALGHPILDSPMQLRDPKVGARLELTIDSSIQAEAENYLAEQVAQSGARRGTAVIIDPFTGEVLALANVSAGHHEGGDRLHDSAVQDAFEPGSTIKGLLGAIALEDHVINTSRQIYCEQGKWQVAGVPLHDDSRYGWLTLGGIIEVSSNIGAAKLALALGRQRFYQGLTAFGLGSKTGIDLPGESSGMLWPPSTWREIELANHGFGQGLAVTALQLVTAYATIANGGLVMRPHVVKAAYDGDGHEVLVNNPQVMRRAITPAVAHTMNQLLRGVIDGRDGTAHLARVADFTVAGKTGSAQIVNPATGAYYHDRLVASFVGFVPAEDPKLVILVVLYDVPHGHFGGLVAAPVFSKIASDALRRMAVAPANPMVERAALLPIGNILGFFSSPDKEDNVSDPAAADSRELPGFAEPYPAESATTQFAENNLRIPDFRGLSLRSALALARTYQLALEVKGDGYVVSQQPTPGVAARPNQLLNPEEPKGSVQILLAAPDQSAPDALPLLEAYLRPAPTPRVHAAAMSLMAGPPRFGQEKPEVRPLAFTGKHRRRYCREGSEIRTRCVAR